MTRLIRVARPSGDGPYEMFVYLKMDYRGVPPVVQAFSQLAAKRVGKFRIRHRTIGSEDD